MSFNEIYYDVFNNTVFESKWRFYFVLKTTEIVEKNLRLRLQARSDGAGTLTHTLEGPEQAPRDQGPEVKH